MPTRAIACAALVVLLPACAGDEADDGGPPTAPPPTGVTADTDTGPGTDSADSTPMDGDEGGCGCRGGLDFMAGVVERAPHGFGRQVLVFDAEDQFRHGG